MSDDPRDGLVEVIAEEPGWATALPDLPALAETAAGLALTAEARDPTRWTLALLACSDARIATLNAEFRSRARPTNVLSWPSFTVLPRDDSLPTLERTHLGDLAIALETVAFEADQAGISLKHHAIHLILHGCLHLLGYDHANEAEAVRMERTEARLLAGLGIADPYQRGSAPSAHLNG
ncbi:MAG: rRNA maturation RNase YbeY [Pseudomonadota bacterium]